MTIDDAFAFAADVAGVVCLAVPLAFVAWVWSRAGVPSAILVFAVVFSAYMTGRWQAGRAFARELALIRKELDKR